MPCHKNLPIFQTKVNLIVLCPLLPPVRCCRPAQGATYKWRLQNLKDCWPPSPFVSIFTNWDLTTSLPLIRFWLTPLPTNFRDRRFMYSIPKRARCHRSGLHKFSRCANLHYQFFTFPSPANTYIQCIKDKIGCELRFSNCFLRVPLACLPWCWQQGKGQQCWYTSAIRKQLAKPTVQPIHFLIVQCHRSSRWPLLWRWYCA